MLIFSLFVFDKLWHKHMNKFTTVYLKKFSVCQIGNNMLVHYNIDFLIIISLNLAYIEEKSYNAIQYKWIQLNTIVFMHGLLNDY